jgi:hypothetical protein
MGTPRAVRRILLPTLLVLALALTTATTASGFERLGQYGVGLPEGGSGQIILPTGVGVSPDGTVAVSDIGTTRVDVFSQGGTFLRAFGKDVSTGAGTGPEVCVSNCQAGTSGEAAGELAGNWGLAAGAEEIYVSELGNDRVSVFNYDGGFLRAFGANVGGPGVNVCTSTCVGGSPGEKAGQMAAPGGLALDASGSLYVSELGLNRIDVYNPQTGQFLRAFGKNVGGAGVNSCTATCSAGVADLSPGSINLAYSVSIAPNGEIFAAESAANRVSVFGTDGVFQRAFGAAGGGAGKLAEPKGVAVDAPGDAFVADTGNDRISTFGTAGDFRASYGYDVIPGPPLAAESCTSVCQPGVANFALGSFLEPQGMATDCRGAVYVGMIGRIDKWGDPGVRLPPCPSNDFSLGKLRRNKKKGFVTVEVTVPGPGALVAAIGKKLKATVPQPVAAGTLRVKVKALGKGVRTLKRKGKLRGRLSLTFTPPNGDPNTLSRKLKLIKKLKKRHKRGKRG